MPSSISPLCWTKRSTQPASARPISTGWCRTRPIKRILDATARKLGLPPEKVIVTVDQHANTSAASVPLALDVSGARRPDQRGRPVGARGDGRRLYLGRRGGPLLNEQVRIPDLLPQLSRALYIRAERYT